MHKGRKMKMEENMVSFIFNLKSFIKPFGFRGKFMIAFSIEIFKNFLSLTRTTLRTATGRTMTIWELPSRKILLSMPWITFTRAFLSLV